MSILVTGASGSLGKEVTSLLLDKSFDFQRYSHSQYLSDIDWEKVTVVINCAAVIPKQGVTAQDYIDGNVRFLQKLLPYCKGKYFIGFSSFSELFRFDSYQHSKYIANSILIANTGIFKGVSIIPLPTLDDQQLIEKIKEIAISGGKPTVDDLDYNYISFSNVASYVLEKIIDWDNNRVITERYEKKNLYQEMCKVVDHKLLVKGKKIDRHLVENDVFCCCPDYLSSLS
ncbi:Rossmann-fold NAD(P)-binding domain-containing protein [Photobacterium sanguinicancri]|uniref:hypothetical protein n=1 Tax=Photobacterium sanguinicancri TaxID=875932 RepID=UPI0021C2F4D8|nr:hypothetical protein [Photobacterium sanguinicancri]